MTIDPFFQELFAMTETYYKNKMGELDKDEIIENLSHLNKEKITKVFHYVIKKRAERAIFTPPPSHFIRISKELYPINKTVRKEIIFDDCNCCYSTGLIHCCKKGDNSLKESNYNIYFLCFCNNSTKINNSGNEKYKIWRKELLQYFLPINKLIKEKYNNSYTEFKMSEAKKLFEYTQKAIFNNTPADQKSVLKITKFKKLSLNKEVFKQNEKKAVES